MKRAELLALFPDATEEQINSLMKINGEDINNAKAKLTADQEELARLKAIEEEFEKSKNASLSAEEKYNKLLKDAEKQKTEYAKELNKMKAENILVGAGLTADDYKDILDGFVSEDADKTTSLATNFANVVKAKTEAAGKAKEAELLQNMTPPPIGGNTKTTKEQFKDMSYSDKAKLYQENPALFAQLNE
jgi:transketolase